MERVEDNARLERGAPELIWVFLAAALAAGFSLVVTGAGRAVVVAFGPAFVLAAAARLRIGNWRLAAVVFLLAALLLAVACYAFGWVPHPSGSSRLGRRLLP